MKEQRAMRPLGKTEADGKAEYEMITKAKILMGIARNIENIKDHYVKGLCGKCLEAWKGRKSRKKRTGREERDGEEIESEMNRGRRQ